MKTECVKRRVTSEKYGIFKHLVFILKTIIISRPWWCTRFSSKYFVSVYLTMNMQAETCIKNWITEILSSDRRYWCVTATCINWSLSLSYFLHFRLSRPLKSFDPWANFYKVRNRFQLFVNDLTSICKTYDKISMGERFTQHPYQLLEFMKTGSLHVKTHMWSLVLLRDDNQNTVVCLW
jgi:hypothetical protein